VLVLVLDVRVGLDWRPREPGLPGRGEGRDGLAVVIEQARQHRQQAARVDSAPRSQRQRGPARGHLFPRVLFNHPRLKQSCSSWSGFLAGYFSFPHTPLVIFCFSAPHYWHHQYEHLFAASPRALDTMLMSVPFTDRPPCHCVVMADAAGVRGSHFWGNRQISPETPEKSFVWHCCLLLLLPGCLREPLIKRDREGRSSQASISRCSPPASRCVCLLYVP
jgi:hypothetical protein